MFKNSKAERIDGDEFIFVQSAGSVAVSFWLSRYVKSSFAVAAILTDGLDRPIKPGLNARWVCLRINKANQGIEFTTRKIYTAKETEEMWINLIPDDPDDELITTSEW